MADEKKQQDKAQGGDAAGKPVKAKKRTVKVIRCFCTSLQ